MLDTLTDIKLKDGLDFQTPREVAKYMVQLVPDGVRTVLEPTPGVGTIVKELTAKGYEVTAPKDFFLLDPARFDCVVMNPPFSSKYAFLENANGDYSKQGMRLGYHFLLECMKMSDHVIALMPWFTISDSDVRLRYLKQWGLKSMTALPRKTFQYARIQTCVFELEKGYTGETLFKVYDLLAEPIPGLFDEVAPAEPECLGDKLLSTLQELNRDAERQTQKLNKLLMELNPDCSTPEEVTAKYNPPKQKPTQQPTEIILSMEAIEVLKQCKVEGMVVKLPEQQLDRKDYEAVKQKLELIGGKWKGGKVGGFVFREDPTELLAQIANGEDRNLKKEYQFFATPAALAEEMARKAFEGRTAPNGQPWRILEPSAGQGAIVEAIRGVIGGNDVYCYEAMPLNQTILQKQPTTILLGDDFLQHTGEGFDTIVANPPFTKNQDIDHIRKMWDVLERGGRIVTLASPGWQTGSTRKQVEFRQWLEQVGAEVEEVPEGTFKESGTNIRTVLITIDKTAA